MLYATDVTYVRHMLDNIVKCLAVLKTLEKGSWIYTRNPINAKI